MQLHIIYTYTKFTFQPASAGLADTCPM